MSDQLRLRIIVQKPPAGVDYALQQGRGAAGKPVHVIRSTGADVVFEFPVLVKNAPAAPSLTGPFIQGTPEGRFIYLRIGTLAGQTDTPIERRLKVMQATLNAALIRDALKAPDVVLEARVPGTGKDGTPTCATMHPPDGWVITR
ncbi:MAG TPA: DUF5990 family protein [Planctomycetia bacterium]|nr:DUF5990 family protein [Planctomycetia bacterium]